MAKKDVNVGIEHASRLEKTLVKEVKFLKPGILVNMIIFSQQKLINK